MKALDDTPPESSVEEFLERIQPRLKTLFKRQHVPPEDAEDILQQTLLSLIYQWQNVRDPETWLFGTLRNKCRLYWRERRRQLYEAVDLAVLDWLADPQPPQQEQEEMWADFETLLDRLPARCRTLLRLRYGLGYKTPEIADQLGYSRASINKVAGRCLAALTHLLMRPLLRPPRG